jgi:hypothetical protein
MTLVKSRVSWSAKRRGSLWFSILLVTAIWLLGSIAAYAQETIYCGSEDGRRHTCSVDTRGGVRLLEQKSDANCVQGRSWGYERNYIWVSRGCRADFEVGDRRHFDRGGDRDRDRGRFSHGSVTWTGKVDHDIKLIIYDNRLEVFTQSGKDRGQGRYYFSSPLPRDARVSVRRVKGRNDIYVTDQPERRNDFKAVVRITDSRGGDDDTEVIISW